MAALYLASDESRFVLGSGPVRRRRRARRQVSDVRAPDQSRSPRMGRGWPSSSTTTRGRCRSIWTRPAAHDGGPGRVGRRAPAAAPFGAVAAGWPVTRSVAHWASSTLAAPVGRVGKIVAVGKNYREHAAEEGVDASDDADRVRQVPELRSSDPTPRSAGGPRTPARSTGRRSSRSSSGARPAMCRSPTPSTTCSATPASNDVSARDLQFGDGQWMRGKSLDTFCPIGPWLVTADEIPDPQVPAHPAAWSTASASRTRRRRQMVHGVAELDRLLLAVHDPGARRRHRDRDAGRRRRLPNAAAVPRRTARRSSSRSNGIGRLRNRCRVLPD